MSDKELKNCPCCGNKVKNCPCCGNKAVLISNTPKYGKHSHRILCQTCGVGVLSESGIADVKSKLLNFVFEKWNTRQPDPRIKEALEESVYLLKFALNVIEENDLEYERNESNWVLGRDIESGISKIQSILQREEV